MNKVCSKIIELLGFEMFDCKNHTILTLDGIKKVDNRINRPPFEYLLKCISFLILFVLRQKIC